MRLMITVLVMGTLLLWGILFRSRKPLVPPHICNSSILEVEVRRLWVQGRHGETVAEQDKTAGIVVWVSSTGEVKAGESRVPNHRQPFSEFQVSLDCMRLCFKPTKTSDPYSLPPYSAIYGVLVDVPFQELLFQPQHCQESNLYGREIIKTATYNGQCPATLQHHRR